MNVNKLSIYHKDWKIELDKTGERIPEIITVTANGLSHTYVKENE